jgi:hypothetical protein
MTFSLLFSVVKLGPLTVPKRAKRKPIHRVAQVLVTGETKLYDPALTAGFSYGHRSRLGLKMTRGLPATLGIVKFGPDGRHQRSRFSARLGKEQRGDRGAGRAPDDVRGGREPLPHLFVETVDQFGPRTLEAVAARVLLLPTEKVAVEGKPTKLGFPSKLNHYWCYQVSCAAREGDTVAAPSCDGSHTAGERFSFNFVAVP